MAFKSKRSNATNFSIKVKNEMLSRDGYVCILCGSSYGLTPAHYIGRGRGGLGIIENGACICVECHMKLDQSAEGPILKERFKNYLDRFYPNFTDEQRTFKKGVEYQ